jgi:predicted metal-binding protein
MAMLANQHSGVRCEAPDAQARVTVFVCLSCRRVAEGAETVEQPGADLVDALQQRLNDAGAGDVTVTGMECLAVCKRPCTVAVTAAGCWTYIVGDLDPAEHAGDIVDAVLSYRRSGNGIVPWKERPACFRKGVIARVPPLGFVQPEPESP